MFDLFAFLRASVVRLALLFRGAAGFAVSLALFSVCAGAANVAPLAATVNCSSQRPTTGQLCAKAVDGVAAGYPNDYTKEWATQGEKAGAWIQLNWAVAETVDRVVFNDRPNSNDQVLSGILSFSDGSTVPVGALANNGVAVTIAFTARVVTSVRFTITGVAGTTANIGLAELGVLEPTLNSNRPPLAANSSVVVPENSAYHGELRVTDVDNNTLTFSIVSQGLRGKVTLDNVQTGAFMYVPNVGALGNDSFTFKANDGTSDSNIATVAVTIKQIVAADSPPIMIVVAHPDDESIMAAGVLNAALDRGAPIKVVIVTNGDLNGANTAGVTRQQEAMTALVARLGLHEDNVIFLGYADAGLARIYNNYPNVTDSGFISAAGKSKTYAQRGLGFADFHTYKTGSAANYNRANLTADLTDLLARYHSTRIFSHSPADEHSDHRTVGYVLRDALRGLVATDSSYFPEVFSAIVHSPTTYPYTDFWVATDFTNRLKLSFPQDSLWPAPAYNGVSGAARFTPTINLTEPLNLALTPWQWSARQEFPVPAIMQTTTAANNLKYQMLTSHASQIRGNGFLYAFGKRNEVFWRTWDKANLAPRAQVTASSERRASFQTASRLADGIVDGAPRNSQAEWTAQSQTVEAWVRFTWPTKQPIESVTLYDRLALGQQVTAGELRFDDGSRIPFGPLPDDGSALVVPVGFKSSAFVEIGVTGVSQTTIDAGLAEVEILAPLAALPSNRAPYFTFGPIAGQYQLGSGGTTSLRAQVGDLDGDALTVSWNSQLRGYLGAGTAINYTALVVNAPTQDTITATVSDGINAPVRAVFVLAVAPVEPVNLALKRPVATSTVEVVQFPGPNAVDGLLGTRWSSKFADPQWIYVDLGATYNVNRVVLNWEVAYALQYRLEVSNDATNWTAVYTETAGNGATDDVSFASRTGRYVRMYSTKRGTPYGNSLWEFKVYAASQ